jgi:hypothetical protein
MKGKQAMMGAAITGCTESTVNISERPPLNIDHLSTTTTISVSLNESLQRPQILGPEGRRCSFIALSSPARSQGNQSPKLKPVLHHGDLNVIRG